MTPQPEHASPTEHKVSLPTFHPPSPEKDKTNTGHAQRAQWLRAAILGANDGLLSTTSLMLGIGATSEDHRSMLLSGIAGAVAGACSMAVGEFVSVSTQRDIEKTEGLQSRDAKPMEPAMVDVGIEHQKKLASPVVVVASPVMTPDRRVASLMRTSTMRVIAMNASARNVVGESLGMEDDETLPNPLKAAAASAFAFLCGSIVPLVSTIAVRESEVRVLVLAIVSSVALVVFGAVGAYLGGSPVRISAVRVLMGGWAAMAITYGLMKPFEKEHGKDDKH